MLRTLINLLTRRPDLLLDHALAYSALARTEIGMVKRILVRRVVAGAIALASMMAFLILAGVALMFVATEHAYTGWVLFAVPAVMFLVALIAASIALASGSPPSQDSLGTQLQRDLQAFRAALEPQS